MDIPAIRPATPADADAIGRLLNDSYGTLMRSHYDARTLATALPIIATANAELLACGTYYVAVAADAGIVGAGGWTRERPGTGETAAGVAHIRHFATAPSWTGRGIGRALAERCIDDARAAGVVRLEVYASLNAEDFYRKIGFLRIEEIEIDLGEGVQFAAALMACEI